MKVCAKNRKPLAWLAVGAADEDVARKMRAHVAECEGCRAYLAEMEDVANETRDAEARPVDPSPFLRRRVRRAILEERRQPALLWRVAIPGIGFAAIFIMYFARLAPAPGPEPIPVQVAIQTEAPRVPDMTVLTYETAAGESPDKLDSLLTAQGNRGISPAPVYRAGSLRITD